MRKLLLPLIALPLLIGVAAAQEAVWGEVHESEGIHTLVYGVPESDDAQIFLSCDDKSDAVNLSWHATIEKPAGMQTDPDGLRVRLEGQVVEIRFTEGDQFRSEIVSNAAYQPEEMYGAIFVEFSLPKESPVLDRFRTSSEAALMVPGAEPQSLDLKGADEAIGKLLDACN